MAEWFDKLKDMIMGEADEYEEYDEYENEDEDVEEAPRAKSSFASSKNNRQSSAKKTTSTRNYSSYGSSNSQRILSINTNVNMQVVVATPTTLEEASEACEDLKDKKTLVVNLEGIERDNAQRITDFFCGACYALDGTIQPISNRIFIIGPYDVKLTGQFKQELEASGIKLAGSMWR